MKKSEIILLALSIAFYFSVLLLRGRLDNQEVLGSVLVYLIGVYWVDAYICNRAMYFVGAVLIPENEDHALARKFFLVAGVGIMSIVFFI